MEYVEYWHAACNKTIPPRIAVKKMNRITQLDPVQATGKTKQLFEAVQIKLGVVPNLFRVLGVAPAALEGYLNFA